MTEEEAMHFMRAVRVRATGQVTRQMEKFYTTVTREMQLWLYLYCMLSTKSLTSNSTSVLQGRISPNLDCAVRTGRDHLS